MNEITLAVEGMTCGGCVNSVKNVLSGLPGVESAEVSLAPGEARVRYDPARVEPAAMVKAIVDAGFSVRA